MSGGGSGAGGEEGDSGKITLVEAYIERTPEALNMIEIIDALKD